jgi:hypothetical protein
MRPKSDISRRGRIEGKQWAKRRATFNELDRLAELDARIGRDWASWARREDGMLALPQLMGSVPEGDHDASAAFWRDVAGPEWELTIQDQEFVEGFVEGVLDVYAKVAGQMGHA